MEASHSGTSVPKCLGFETAKAIATICPDALFCSFQVTDDGKKIPYNKIGQGVAADTPVHLLYTADELLAGTKIRPNHHWGVVMQHPTTDAFQQAYLTVLDVDMKRSDAPPDIRIGRLAKWSNENSHLTERSHSKKGRHVIFLAKPDTTLPKKVKLENRQEIEIFGHDSSAGKSVMLTDDMLTRDQLNPRTVDVRQVFNEIGVDLSEPEPTKQPTLEFKSTSTLSDDMAKTEDALSYIDPDLDYNEWIAIGQALHDAYGHAGLSIWHAWSQTGTKYQGDKDIDTHWKSFHQGKGVGLGSLFHMAKQNGWEQPTKQSERRTAVQDFQEFIRQQPTISTPNPPPEEISGGWNEVSLNFGQIKPTRYLIEGFLAHGLWLIAGQPGVGKTTVICSLMLTMFGHDNGLRAKQRRKVIVVSEDVDQIHRTMYAYIRFHGVPEQLIKDNLVLIEAKRSTLPEILDLYHNIDRHTVNGVRPFLILDTANAVLDLESENDNSEVGAYMNGIKQTIYTQMDTPVAIIGHTNKQISKTDSDAMARGASAFTGDATGTAVVFQDEDGTRYIRLVKTRYEPTYRELGFTSETHNVMLLDDQGEPTETVLRTMTPFISDEQQRKQQAHDKREAEQDQRQKNLLDECHTAFLQYAANHQNAYIKVGKTNTQPPENATVLSVHEWIKDCGIRGTGNTTARRELTRQLVQMLGGGSMAGYLKV